MLAVRGVVSVGIFRIFHWNGEEWEDGKVDEIKVNVTEREQNETTFPVWLC